MKASHDRIIVKVEENIVETSTGIQFVSGGPRRAKVLSVGEGRLLDNGRVIPLGVNEGEEVLLRDNCGSEFQNEEGTFLTILEEDIIGVIG